MSSFKDVDSPATANIPILYLFHINLFDFSRLDFSRFPKEDSNKGLAYIRIEPQAHQPVNSSVAGNKFFPITFPIPFSHSLCHNLFTINYSPIYSQFTLICRYSDALSLPLSLLLARHLGGHCHYVLYVRS